MIPPEQQFDFWLGEWDVSWDGGRATNRIERILDGRVTLEQFQEGSEQPFRGMSVSVYKPSVGKWQQTWVDNQGNYWNFTGGLETDRMILITRAVVEGKSMLLRMVWYNISENALDWNWERSADEGETWELRWKIHYERRMDGKID